MPETKDTPTHNSSAKRLLVPIAVFVAIAVVAAWLFLKDGGNSSEPVSVTVENPLHQMRYDVLNGRMAEAWQYADDVLKKHGDDAEAVALVARVAHANDATARAAELLAKSCELESYASEQRNQQAVVALIGIGQLYEATELLEKVVETQPSQTEPRRLLYDFYVGTENRPLSVEHGRQLVRQRKFDTALLMNLGNTDRRSLDVDPLAEMLTRNPEDKRLSIGNARIQFDRGEIEESISTLKEILKSHPDFVPAQTLLCSAYASSSQFKALEKHVQTCDEDAQSFAAYWIAMGDWAREKELHDQAARCYWEATRADPDYAVGWVKLNSSLQQMPSEQQPLSPAEQQAIQSRASLLSRFSQQLNRFERSGKISREMAVDIAKSLSDLGRLWEAEAWAANALTLPKDESVPVEKVRGDIVKLLSKSTPWQTTDVFPEFSVNLSGLQLASLIPKLSHTQSKDAAALPGKEDLQSQVPYRLTNEAEKRGLSYFGRTHDKLHEPGIVLHRTLGCGGGTIDFDLDGWSDLYLVSAGGDPAERNSYANALMRNIGGRFLDATSHSKSGDKSFGQGVAIGDVNSDGFADMFVLNYGQNTLYINNGDGTFTDATEQKVPDTGHVWSTSAAIADIDGDSISDIVIVQYCDGMEPATKTCVMEDSDVFRSCTPMAFSAASDVFLQGRESGVFANVTDTWDAKPDVPGRGLGIEVGNFDNQPGIDVFIANDMTANHYWSASKASDGEALNLRESAMLCGLGTNDQAIAQGSMGIATGDFDRDGDIDFYVTNFYDEFNTYHDNRGGVWQDLTKRVKLSKPTLPLVGFGTEAVDVDNDGNLELVLSNGHVDMFSRDDERSVYDQPMQVFRRTESGDYQSVGEMMTGDYVSSPHVGRALWTIDADRDGQQDLVVTHQTEPTALLMNESADAGKWIRLELKGTVSERDAIGTTVTVTNGNNRWTTQLVSGDGYLCSNERTVHIGLGHTADPCLVEVQWPSGRLSSYKGLAAKTWLIVEGQSVAYPRDSK